MGRSNNKNSSTRSKTTASTASENKQSGAMSRSRSRNDRRSKKPNKTNDERDSRTAAQSYANDPAWYTSDPALARDAASIPFSWATGTTTALNPDFGVNPAINTSNSAGFNFTAPGCLIEWLRPSLGNAQDPIAPINVASNAIYAYVRHANSGHTNYDPCDLTMYLIAIGEIIAFTNFLIRAYGTASLVSGRNRYFPKVLLESQQIDADDLTSHLAQFRYDINLAMNKVSSFAVPANFTYFKRKSFLFSGIYSEGTSAKDQTYLYAPAAYYQLGSDADYATALVMKKYFDGHSSTGFSHLYTTSELIQMLNDMIDPLVMSEDINIMSGDILKAYGEAGIIKFGRVDPDFTMNLTLDIAVLEQMKNATILPEFYNASDDGKVVVHQGKTKAFIVTEDSVAKSGSFSPASPLQVTQVMSTENRILTTTTAEVSPELVLESTRLMVGVEIAQEGNVTISTAYSGTEIAVRCVITRMRADTADESDYNLFPIQTFWAFACDAQGIISQSAAIMTTLLGLSSLAAFKFMPNMFWTTYYASTASSYDLKNQFDFVAYDNYAVLTRDELRRMHEACLLNMMRVPAIGSAYSV